MKVLDLALLLLLMLQQPLKSQLESNQAEVLVVLVSEMFKILSKINNNQRNLLLLQMMILMPMLLNSWIVV
jgi:hypothetical protein